MYAFGLCAALTCALAPVRVDDARIVLAESGSGEETTSFLRRERRRGVDSEDGRATDAQRR